MSDYKWRSRRNYNSAEDDSIIRKTIEKLLLSEDFINKFREIIDTKLPPTLEQQTKMLQCKVEQLQRQLIEMNGKMDCLEQYSCINNLRFSGISECESEDTTQVAVEFCQVHSQDIDFVHRLKHAENVSNPIIAKFTNRTMKKEICSNKSKLKSTRTVIKEDITSNRVTILRELTKIMPKKSTWTNDGKIFCKIGNNIHFCRSLDDVRRISSLPTSNGNDLTC
ncbi:hypothetical protein Trydic_g7847 [Trypoxylus dichotomus]